MNHQEHENVTMLRLVVCIVLALFFAFGCSRGKVDQPLSETQPAPLTEEEGELAVESISPEAIVPVSTKEALEAVFLDPTVSQVVDGASQKPIAEGYCTTEPKKSFGNCPVVTVACSDDNKSFTGIRLDFNGGQEDCGCAVRGHQLSGAIEIGKGPQGDWKSLSLKFVNFTRDGKTVNGEVNVAWSKTDEIYTFEISTLPGKSLTVTQTRKLKTGIETTVTRTLTLSSPTRIVIDKAQKETRLSWNAERTVATPKLAKTSATRTRMIDSESDAPLVFMRDGTCVGPRSGALTSSVSIVAGESYGGNVTLSVSLVFGFTKETAPAGYRCPELPSDLSTTSAPEGVTRCSRPCYAVSLKGNKNYRAASTDGEWQALVETMAASLNAIAASEGKAFGQYELAITAETVVSTIQGQIAPVSQQVQEIFAAAVVRDALKSKFESAVSTCEVLTPVSSCDTCTAGAVCLCAEVNGQNECVSFGCAQLKSTPDQCVRAAASCQLKDGKTQPIALAIQFDEAGCKSKKNGATYFGSATFVNLSNPLKSKAQMRFVALKSVSTFGNKTITTSVNGAVGVELQQENPLKVSLKADPSEPLVLEKRTSENGVEKAACSKSLTLNELTYEHQEGDNARHKITADVSMMQDEAISAFRTLPSDVTNGVDFIYFDDPSSCACPFGKMAITYPEVQGLSNVTVELTFAPHTPTGDAPHCAEPTVKITSPAPESFGQCADGQDAGCKVQLCNLCKAKGLDACRADSNCLGLCNMPSCAAAPQALTLCVEKQCYNLEQFGYMQTLKVVELTAEATLKASCLPPQE